MAGRGCRPSFAPVVLAMAWATACNAKAPAGPSQSPAPVPASSVEVSGTVYEHGPFGLRPLASVPLYATPGYEAAPTTTSDVNGRYRMISTSGRRLVLRADAPGHQQPCRSGAVLEGDATLDVHLVPNDVLLTSGLPVTVPTGTAQVSGRVLDATDPDNVVPLAGASVSGSFETEVTFGPSVHTLSDATGHYVLCGIRDRLEMVASVQGPWGAFYGQQMTVADLIESPSATFDFRLGRID